MISTVDFLFTVNYQEKNSYRKNNHYHQLCRKIIAVCMDQSIFEEHLTDRENETKAYGKFFSSINRSRQHIIYKPNLIYCYMTPFFPTK